MNTIGEHFTFTSFGESHGRAIGGVLDGVPAGLAIDMDMISQALDRRAGRIAHSPSHTSPRAKNEPDKVEWLSGVLNGVTLGTPIAFLIRNCDARSEDYEWLKHSFRLGHADFTYQQKYGIRDYRGGGRASARETAARVVAGSVARQLLTEKGITIHAELVQVGEEKCPACFDTYIATIQQKGDSVGGVVRCTVKGVPVGVGEPIFDKLQAHLAFGMLSINGCKGFDYGSGFEHVEQLGSSLYLSGDPTLVSGGIAGGISDGSPIVFRCVFKPTPSNPKTLMASCASPITSVSSPYPLRMDACIAVRAVPIVETMTALILCDFMSHTEQSNERLHIPIETIKSYYAPTITYPLSPSERTIEHTIKVLQELMDNPEVWQNPDLVRDDLVTMAGSNRTYIEVVAKRMGFKNLADMVHRSRINYVCQQLRSNPERNLQSLFYDAGYHSRTTAWRHFVEIVGCTPTEFVARNLPQSREKSQDV